MKVQLLTSATIGSQEYAEGAEVEVSDYTGEKLMARGIAAKVEMAGAVESVSAETAGAEAISPPPRSLNPFRKGKGKVK